MDANKPFRETCIALLQSMAEEEVAWRKCYASTKLLGVEKGKPKAIPVFVYFFREKRKEEYAVLYVGLNQVGDRCYTPKELLSYLRQASAIYKFKEPKQCEELN